MTMVAIAGKFDPPHEGHIAHIKAAARLGDFLCIITHSDDIVANNSAKGGCLLSFNVRQQLLAGLLALYKIRGNVVQSIDTDGTITRTLLKLQPDIYAKGGDRIPGNMPQSEIEACKKIGCKIIYGVGGKKIKSSSEMVIRCAKRLSQA